MEFKHILREYAIRIEKWKRKNIKVLNCYRIDHSCKQDDFTLQIEAVKKFLG